MIRIKTFQFLLSNSAGNELHRDNDAEFRSKINARHPLMTEREIDKKINQWILKNEAVVKDIRVTTYTVDRHNNGRHDTVIALYTVVYEDPKEEA